ncbi:MAG: HAMP domain-containing sensor histidine kinase [Acidimicrobiia bacterium]
MSLRRRLALASGLTVALLTAVAALVLVTSQWNLEKGRITDAAELASIDQADGVSAVDGETALLPRGSADLVIAVDGGDVVASSGRAPDDVVARALESAGAVDEVDDDTVSLEEFDSDGATWATAAMSCLDPDACTAMVVGVRAPTWFGALADRLVLVVVAVAGLAALAALGAAWLASRALRPVEAMRAEVAATTATDLSRRVPVRRTGDELERLATTLNDTLTRLEAAVSANERFVADAAHELRSPLAGIRAAVELRAAADDLLADAVDEIDRASRLVDDLLLLARGGGLATHREMTDLSALVRDDVDAADTRHTDLKISESTEPVRADVQRTTMSRVIRNLLDNAAVHGAGRVEVAVTANGSWAQVVIDDNGDGVPIQDRQRVFERFVRLDESRARASGGTGIGLAIVKEGVEAHGGTVTVQDSPLGGARFVVALPLTRDPQANPATENGSDS